MAHDIIYIAYLYRNSWKIDEQDLPQDWFFLCPSLTLLPTVVLPENACTSF